MCRSDCEGGCGGSGFQHRERDVLSPPTGNGRKCPSLEEVRPCDTPPCPKDRLVDFMTDCGLADPRGKQDGGEIYEIVWLLLCQSFFEVLLFVSIISALYFSPDSFMLSFFLFPFSPCSTSSVHRAHTRARPHVHVGTSDLSKELLGASNPADLFELDNDDLKQLGLKVSRASWLHGLLVACCFRSCCCLLSTLIAVGILVAFLGGGAAATLAALFIIVASIMIIIAHGLDTTTSTSFVFTLAVAAVVAALCIIATTAIVIATTTATIIVIIIVIVVILFWIS